MTVLILDKENRDYFRNLFSEGAWRGLEDWDTIALGAVLEDGTPAGCLSLRVEGEYGELTWLYVEPAFRQMGAGSGMLDLLLKAAGSIGLRTVYGAFPEERMQDPALMVLLLDRDFRIEPTKCGIITTSIGKLSGGRLPKETVMETVPLEKLTDEVKLAWIREGMDQPLEGYLPESRACLSGGQVQGVLLLEGAGDGGVILSSAWNRKGNPAVSQSLLAAGCAALEKAYPPETPLYLETMDLFSRQLAKLIDPDAPEQPMYAVQRTLPLAPNQEDSDE